MTQYTIDFIKSEETTECMYRNYLRLENEFVNWLRLFISPFKTQLPATSPTCAASGVPGVPGVPGLNGRDGARGDRGPVGPSGKTGPQGLEGAKGAKGDQAQAPLRNWKQCAWKDLNDGRDYGLIKVTETGLILKWYHTIEFSYLRETETVSRLVFFYIFNAI